MKFTKPHTVRTGRSTKVYKKGDPFEVTRGNLDLARFLEQRGILEPHKKGSRAKAAQLDDLVMAPAPIQPAWSLPESEQKKE